MKLEDMNFSAENPSKFPASIVPANTFPANALMWRNLAADGDIDMSQEETHNVACAREQSLW
jgi:hypothetical protein